MVGRPRQFEHDKALGAAMGVFWVKGYEAASVQDLLDAMGINRGSMYDSFGDKHDLFIKAIEHYGRTIMAEVLDTLEADGSPLGNIRRLMHRWASTGTDRKQCRGCLLGNTVVELAPRDAQVARLAGSMLGKLEKSLQRALQRAVAAGELARNADTRALARFLTSTLQGIMVMAKAGAPPAALRDIAGVSLVALEQ